MKADLTLLNLGCGIKTAPFGTNIDFSLFHMIKHYHLYYFLPTWLIGKSRKEKINLIPDNIMYHDLTKGIPFAEGSASAVYHSHILEHIDYDQRTKFYAEIFRVLKPGGIHRICVPDLHAIVSNYISSFETALKNESHSENHEKSIVALLEQHVRKESHGTSKRKGIMRWFENFLLGDARARAETHQWMYDEVSLSVSLRNAGFDNITVMEYNASNIDNWEKTDLEVDENGKRYKNYSVYIECTKPCSGNS